MNDLPDLDPRQPGIYRAIIDAAEDIRERRQSENQAMRMAARKIERIKMRSIASKFDSQLDREIVQTGKVRRKLERRLVHS